MKSWLHDGTFTNPGISNSTFVATCKAFERVVLNNVAREQLKAKYGG